LKLSLTDAATDQYKAVYVTFDAIEVHFSDAADDSWETLTNLNFPITINLLDLMNGVRTELGIATLHTGHITQMRLKLTEQPQPGHLNIFNQLDPTGNYVITSDNLIHELKIPSGFQSGLKINIDADINANETTEVLLDFDASKSIVVTGSEKYILKPVIKATTTLGAIVSGTVTSNALPVPGALVSVQIPTTDPIGALTVEASTVTDASGFYKLIVLPGTYNIVVSKVGFNPALQTVTLAPGEIHPPLDFVLATTTIGAVTEQVIIAGSDPNNPSFVTTSFRQNAPNSLDIIEVFTINIASDSEVTFNLNTGTYTAVSSTFSPISLTDVSVSESVIVGSDPNIPTLLIVDEL
jgi:hypothetical protein